MPENGLPVETLDHVGLGGPNLSAASTGKSRQPELQVPGARK